MDIRDNNRLECNPFEGFNPELTDSRIFIDRLEDRLDAVESVQKELSAESRNTTRAAWLAAVAGFFTGLVSSIVCPKLYDIFTQLFTQTPQGLNEINGSLLFTCFATASLTIASVFYTFRTIRTNSY